MFNFCSFLQFFVNAQIKWISHLFLFFCILVVSKWIGNALKSFVTCVLELHVYMPWFFQLFFSLKYLFRNILLRCKWLTYFVFFVFLFRQTITQLHFKFDENTRQNLYIRFFRFNFASYLIHFHSFASIISIL